MLIKYTAVSGHVCVCLRSKPFLPLALDWHSSQHSKASIWTAPTHNRTHPHTDWTHTHIHIHMYTHDYMHTPLPTAQPNIHFNVAPVSSSLLPLVTAHTETHLCSCPHGSPNHIFLQTTVAALFLFFYCSCKASGNTYRNTVSPHILTQRFILNGLSHNVSPRCTQLMYEGAF